MTDHLNSVRLVLDESGAVLDQIAYDAFGNIVAQLNPLLVNPILFASREFDAETGLYSNRARYLDPTTGRWTMQDTLGSDVEAREVDDDRTPARHRHQSTGVRHDGNARRLAPGLFGD